MTETHSLNGLTNNSSLRNDSKSIIHEKALDMKILVVTSSFKVTCIFRNKLEGAVPIMGSAHNGYP